MDVLQELKDKQIQHHEETREELKEAFQRTTKSALEADKLSKGNYEQLQALPLETLDELETAYTQYIDMLSRPKYYKLSERLIKGAEYLERTDITEEQRVKGVQLYNQLCAELEGMKDGAAL